MAPISIGELLDKITILEIKLKYARLGDQRRNIEIELAELESLLDNSWSDVIDELKPRLSEVNARIWDEEEHIRNKHFAQSHDSEFVKSAISIFTLNDERAAIKRLVNDRLKSEIVEEKIYSSGILGDSPC